MKKIILMLVALFSLFTSAQTKKFIETELAVNPLINGTLYLPENNSAKTKLVILIAGSGPTDRNGNQPGAVTNFAKKFATAVAEGGNAVFAYDKRMFAQMKSGEVKEESMRFDDGIKDVKDIIDYFKLQKKFEKIIIAGHSEGSLIGMIAAHGNADAYISLAGVGTPADEIILEQITKQAPMFKEEVRKNLATLKSGQTFTLENQLLASLFRESVQPYMISWFKYNPQEEIKKLTIPTLIVNGTKDLQVTVKELDLLKAAQPAAQVAVVENMNHLFREIKGDDNENRASYTDANLPVMPELIRIVNQFLKSI